MDLKIIVPIKKKHGIFPLFVHTGVIKNSRAGELTVSSAYNATNPLIVFIEGLPSSICMAPIVMLARCYYTGYILCTMYSVRYAIYENEMNNMYIVIVHYILYIKYGL